MMNLTTVPVVREIPRIDNITCEWKELWHNGKMRPNCYQLGKLHLQSL